MDNTDIQKYSRLGIAALLPGLVHAHENLGRQIEQLRNMLADLQAEHPKPKGKRHTVWSDLNAEQRSVEMKRRRAVAQAKREAARKLHPRDSEHPKHAEWVQKMSAVTKKNWAALNAREHRARLDRMRAGKGRSKKRLPTVHLAKNQAENVGAVA